MAKRTAKQIRIDALEEVRRKDEAKQALKKADRPALERWPTKIKTAPKKRVPTGECCVDKLNGDMPTYFRPCPDCPKER